MATKAKGKRAAIYTRVSTDHQTTENQSRELREMAQRMGWEIVREYRDNGISGAKGREHRPAFNELHQGIARREFDVVMAWSVDRLGRSLQDLVAFLSEVHAKRIDLYLHKQGMDTTTPGGKALFQMMGIFAEFEREMIKERVKAGLAVAKARGKRLGRPTVEQAGGFKKKLGEIKTLRIKGWGILRIAKKVGLGVGTVQRLVSVTP